MKNWIRRNTIKIKESPLYLLLKFTWKQYLFWMLFSWFLRLIFLVYNWNEVGNSSIVEVLKLFWHAVYLDNSATGYVMMLPIAVSIIKSCFRYNFFNQFIRIYHFLFIFIATTISIAELPLYIE